MEQGLFFPLQEQKTFSDVDDCIENNEFKTYLADFPAVVKLFSVNVCILPFLFTSGSCLLPSVCFIAACMRLPLLSPFPLVSLPLLLPCFFSLGPCALVSTSMGRAVSWSGGLAGCAFLCFPLFALFLLPWGGACACGAGRMCLPSLAVVSLASVCLSHIFLRCALSCFLCLGSASSSFV